MVGILAIVSGILGFFAPAAMRGGATEAVITTSILSLIIGVVALWVGYRVESVRNVRWFAGIIGTIYLLMGIIGTIGSGAAAAQTTGMPTLASGLLGVASILTTLIGALGLAAALVPMRPVSEQALSPGIA